MASNLFLQDFPPSTTLYVAALEANSTRVVAPKLLVTSSALLVPTAWTPDSRSLIYESTINGKLGFLKESLGGQASQPIIDSIATTPASGAETDRVSARVSPDGKWLLYPVFRSVAGSPNSELMRVPINGGAPQLVLKASLYDAPRCAKLPSTRCIYAEEDKDGNQLRFISFDPEKGHGNVLVTFQHSLSVSHDFTGEDLTRAPYLWDLSPDGTQIAVLERAGQQIHILPIGAGINTRDCGEGLGKSSELKLDG